MGKTIIAATEVTEKLRNIICSLFHPTDETGNTFALQSGPYTIITSFAERESDCVEIISYIVRPLLKDDMPIYKASLINSAVNRLNNKPLPGKYSVRWEPPVLFQYSFSFYIKNDIDEKLIQTLMLSGKEKADAGYNEIKNLF